MKVKYMVATLPVLLFAGIVFAQTMGIKSLGFIAPQISDKSNVYNPSTGEIIYDSSDSKFYGYDQSGTWNNLGSGNTNSIPTGAVIPFAGPTAPAGYLPADGAAVSRTTYASLFDIIGTSYGSGDGSTTFNVPDLRGLFIRGAGSQSVGGLTYSGTLGVKQTDTTKRNGLGISDPGHTHTSNMWHDIWGATGNANNLANGSGTSGGKSSAVSYSTTGVSINGGDSETRPGNIALLYIIKI